VTFNADVAPIVFQHCVACHRDGESASAEPLTTFDSVKKLADRIRSTISNREMPPWPADPDGSVSFRNDPRLSQADIDTVVRWVDAGTPQGDTPLPPLPSPSSHWDNPLGRAPDAVISLPAFTVEAQGEIPYIEQLMKVPYTEDKWVIAMQMRAGNPKILHHMGITEVALPKGMKPADLKSFSAMARTMGIPDNAMAMVQPAVKDPSDSHAYDMFGVYTPGTSFEQFGNDSARLLKAGGNLYIDFNIHYTTIGTVQTDRSQLALWFAPESSPRQLFRGPAAIDSIIANGKELLTDAPGTKAEGTDVAIPPIPAYAADYELVGMSAYRRPVIFYQFQPHAHMRAKDFRYVVVFPDGREQSVLNVPKYDFHEQLAYELATPLVLPAGSKLIVTAHYDNSASSYAARSRGSADPGHHCGPENVAYFQRQNQSWNEMFSPLVQYADEAAGPNKKSSAKSLAVVQVVGCLNPEHRSGWSLLRGNLPRASASEATSAAELAAAAKLSLGDRRYALLGVDAFSPQAQIDHKLAIKGVLIPGRGENRINVTSLQALPGACR